MPTAASADTLGRDWLEDHFKVIASHDLELSFVSSVLESVTEAAAQPRMEQFFAATDVLEKLDLYDTLKEGGGGSESGSGGTTTFLRVQVDHIPPPRMARPCAVTSPSMHGRCLRGARRRASMGFFGT